jgi:hypothetical protein
MRQVTVKGSQSYKRGYFNELGEEINAGHNYHTFLKQDKFGGKIKREVDVPWKIGYDALGLAPRTRYLVDGKFISPEELRAENEL